MDTSAARHKSKPRRTPALRKGHPLAAAALAIGLALLASGAPTVIADALGPCTECCASSCDGSFGGDSCPPNCTSGGCARGHLTLVPTSTVLVAPLPPLAAALPSERELATDGAAADIFHPPRA